MKLAPASCSLRMPTICASVDRDFRMVGSFRPLAGKPTASRGPNYRGNVDFNTQQFDMGSQHRLLAMLREQHGIDCALNRDKRYWRIRVAVASTARLRALIE